MTLPVEKLKLSDKELNCMKICQKAPKCTDFSINPGEACVKKYYSVRGVLLSGRGAGLFRTVFHILIKARRTNYGLKGTYILKACSFYQQGQLILVLL